MTLERLAEQVRRLEAWAKEIARAGAGLVVRPGLNVLGQDTQVRGHLTVDGGMTVTGSVGHAHDDRYYTEGELGTVGQANVAYGNLSGVPATFNPTPHVHDERYYTESELATPGQATVDWGNVANEPATYPPAAHVHDHGELTGLGDDDHAQYLTEGRHDLAARHTIGTVIPAGTPGTITPDAAAAEGSASSVARSDHVHAIAAAAPAANLGATTTNAEGSAASFARSDHSHAIGTAAPSGNLSATSTNSSGASASLSRADHTHAITASAAPAGNSLVKTDSSGNLQLRNVEPQATDTYDLGSSTKLWRKGYLSELDAVLFALNTVQLLGGWLVVGHDEGSIEADATAVATSINFGKTMSPGDFVVFRAAGQVEYVQVGTLVSGTTYNVTRNLDGSGANAWYKGTPFLVLGTSGDGRIELNSYDTPRISVLKQGATYAAQSEMLRLGDLSGFGGSGYGLGAMIGLGKSLLDEQGFWLQDDTGGEIFGVAGVDGKAWAGFTNDRGDVVLGKNTLGSAAIRWDKSAGTFGFYGGGIALPTVIIDTDGSLAIGLGADKVRLDGNGITLPQTGGTIGHLSWSDDSLRMFSFSADSLWDSGFLQQGRASSNQNTFEISVAQGVEATSRALSLYMYSYDCVTVQGGLRSGTTGGRPNDGDVYAAGAVKVGSDAAAPGVKGLSVKGAAYVGSGMNVGGATDPGAGNVRASGTVQAARVTGTTPYVLKVCRNANQSIANGGVATDILWDTEIYDTGNVFPNGGGNQFLVAPEAGYYLIEVDIRFTSTSTTGATSINIMDWTGTNTIASAVVSFNTSTANVSHSRNIHTVRYMAANDSVIVRLYNIGSASYTVGGATAAQPFWCWAGLVRIA